MTKYIHHEFMIIDVGLDYHEKNRDMTGWRFQHVQRCCFFYHPPKRETSSLFSFFLERTHFSTTHMGSSKDLVTQNPIVYHCSSSFIIGFQIDTANPCPTFGYSNQRAGCCLLSYGNLCHRTAESCAGLCSGQRQMFVCLRFSTHIWLWINTY